MGLGIATFALSRLLAAFPGAVETFYARGFAPVVIAPLSRASGAVPFSVGEWVLVAFVGRQIFGAVRGLRAVARKRRGLGNAVAAGALRLGSDLGVVATLFYVLWGFHYARAPLGARLGWPEVAQGEVGELEKLAAEMVAAGNDAYLELHGVRDLGVATPMPDPVSAMEASIDEAWAEGEEAIGIREVGRRRYGRAKRPCTSRVLSLLHLGGFYMPFTGEPTVNGLMPAIAQPHAMAHEKAHQRGLASEDEANFVGFVIASRAGDPLVRYSAYRFAQGQLLSALRAVDRERAVGLIEARLPGVQRDIDDEHAFWAGFEGPGSRVAERVNDAYLRSNRVAGGTASYDRSLGLMLEYARSRGGTLTEIRAP
jgi:hypothetical protein